MAILIPTQADTQLAVDHGYHIHINSAATYASRNKQNPHIGGIELTDSGEWVNDFGDFSTLEQAIKSHREVA